MLSFQNNMSHLLNWTNELESDFTDSQQWHTLAHMPTIINVPIPDEFTNFNRFHIYYELRISITWLLLNAIASCSLSLSLPYFLSLSTVAYIISWNNNYGMQIYISQYTPESIVMPAEFNAKARDEHAEAQNWNSCNSLFWDIITWCAWHSHTHTRRKHTTYILFVALAFARKIEIPMSFRYSRTYECIQI